MKTDISSLPISLDARMRGSLLEEFCRQAWENATTALGAFRSLMETDIPRLNLQQRHTLRDELKSMLAELDRMETAAPELA